MTDDKRPVSNPPASSLSERIAAAVPHEEPKAEPKAKSAAAKPMALDERTSIIAWLRKRTPAESADERTSRMRIADSIENNEDKQP